MLDTSDSITTTVASVLLELERDDDVILGELASSPICSTLYFSVTF